LGQTIDAIISCDCRVISIEPNPICYSLLEKQYGAHHLVSLEKTAIGCKEGTATLNFQGTESTASLLEDWPYETTDSIQTSVTTLDKLIDEHGPPKLIKVDVEGFELEVFKGLSRPIEYLIFEVHRSENKTAYQVLEHLKNIGSIAGIKIINGDLSKWIIDRWSDVSVLDRFWENQEIDYINLVIKMNIPTTDSL
jgi:FkbM family methyltransferase